MIFNFHTIFSIGLALFFFGCKKNDNVQLATLTTVELSSISVKTAVTGGMILKTGNSAITAQGVVWGTSPNPTTANNQINDNSKKGVYSCTLSSLSPNTKYYVRAYATNSEGTAYGNQLSFTTISGEFLNPNLSYGGMSDQEGNNYATIIVGSQEWMAENLNATTFSNGDSIPHVISSTQWRSLNNVGAYSYPTISQMQSTAGVNLYNWFVISDPRNICPTGWHVPSNDEWLILNDYLGGTDAGGKMKSISGWNTPNVSATNESGFSGLPAGYRNGEEGFFNSVGYQGAWWSSTSYNNFNAIGRALFSNNGSVSSVNEDKGTGMSIRCIRD